MPGRNRNFLISALVLTCNEEENIEECLESLKWVDEIVIVDSYSRDRTIDIARKYTHRIFQKNFSGDFSEQRNFGLQKIQSDWVLSIDADERLPMQAESPIRTLMQDNLYDGYWFRRRNYINQTIYLKHGYFYPDYQLRLFRRKSGVHYTGAVHEQPVIDKKATKRVDEIEIIHNPSHTKYNSFLSFFRLLPYIKTEATLLTKKKISSISLLSTGLREMCTDFYRSFFKLSGYRDGYKGLRASLIYSMYRGVVYFTSVLLRLPFF